LILFSKWQKKIKPAAEGKTGPYGEEIAASFLQAQGYAIIERNYRKRFGEIDIIAEDGEELVFIEVKTRKSNRFGSPLEAVDTRKQQKMSRVALAYLNSLEMADRAARFDVVAVLLRGNLPPEIELVKDAFELCNE